MYKKLGVWNRVEHAQSMKARAWERSSFHTTTFLPQYKSHAPRGSFARKSTQKGQSPARQFVLTKVDKILAWEQRKKQRKIPGS